MKVKDTYQLQFEVAGSGVGIGLFELNWDVKKLNDQINASSNHALRLHTIRAKKG